MTETIHREIVSLIRMLLTGCLMAFIYDFFRIIRRLVKHSTVAVAVQDILFFFFMSLITYYTLIKINSGDFRLYFVVGILAGIFVYVKVFSKKIIWLFVGILRFVLKKMAFLFKIRLIIQKHWFKKHRGDNSEEKSEIK